MLTTFLALLTLSGPVASPWRDVRATAYAVDCPGMDSTLADHSPADWHRRSVAVDPAHYPLGTVLEVCFDDSTCRRYTARDTGPKVRGPGRLDILVRSCAYAWDFGRQWVKVRVVNRKPDR